MQGLTKENFFNEMCEKYPLAYQLFSRWVDRFKVDIKYNEIFNEGYEGWGDFAVAPKVHELPFELQFGIMCKFMTELSDDLSLFQFRIDFMKQQFEGMLKIVEENRDKFISKIEANGKLG